MQTTTSTTVLSSLINRHPNLRLLYDDYGDEKFYSREAARAAGHSTDKGFYVNNKNIVELKKWMFNGWTFSGERARGPLKTKDTWFFEFYAPWYVSITRS